ncbi:MAG: hypothetical protein KAH20_15410 [Methylococcales bacterium]|nr:hypothetical protein [Methylococcales bacterium]
MKTKYKPRFTAAGIHFLSSLLIFSILLWVIIKIWYPQPFFSASGGWQGLKIVALVDLVLGPLITLVIYNTEKPKKELYQDIGTIVIIQLAALSFGIYTIYSERPVVLAFWDREFYTIPASALDKQKIDLNSLEQFSDQTPVMVYAEKPTTVEGLKEMLKITQEQQIPPTQQFTRYRPLQSYSQQVLQHSVNISEIISVNKDMAAQLKDLLKETKTQQKDNYYLALKSKYQNIILVFNAKVEQIGYIKAPYIKST